jgi:hypothetical protein
VNASGARLPEDLADRLVGRSPDMPPESAGSTLRARLDAVVRRDVLVGRIAARPGARTDTVTAPLETVDGTG